MRKIQNKRIVRNSRLVNKSNKKIALPLIKRKTGKQTNQKSSIRVLRLRNRINVANVANTSPSKSVSPKKDIKEKKTLEKKQVIRSLSSKKINKQKVSAKKNLNKELLKEARDQVKSLPNSNYFIIVSSGRGVKTLRSLRSEKCM